MPSDVQKYDLVIIGSGPAGEVGAIRAAQLGLKVALVEKAQHLGGTCLNVGCIPTKALLQSATIFDKLKQAGDFGLETGPVSFHWGKIMERKEKIVDQQRKGLRFLMKKNKIDTFEGVGRLEARNKVSVTGSDGKKTQLACKNILIATGSRVRVFPWAQANHKNILTSDSVLFIDKVPKSLAVVGGGVVGCEFASLFARFGTEVIIIELAPQILPGEDDETVSELVRTFKKQGIKIDSGSKLSKLDDKGSHVDLTVEGQSVRSFEKVLLSIGREPVTQDIGLEACGVQVEQGGFIKVNEHYLTSVPGVYAVGDVIKTPALAHTASAEAMHAVEVIAGHHPPVINYEANPNAVYTYPEIASIGKTEKALKAAGIEYKSAKFPFAPLAKAKIENATDGFVKILFEPRYREILGVHIVHAKATEFIAEFVLGKVLETTVDEIGFAIHPHPTLSETMMEAAHAAIGGAIHL